MNRREFIKTISTGAAGAIALASCGDNPTNSITAKGKMTYRLNHSTGDQVSILGFGMMRLPMMEDDTEAHQQVIDQDQVNRLVDLAMKYGVNYYDTSPVYCQGKSEQATGEALSRHPRNKYFVATKLSNFDPRTQTFEESVKMYHDSMEYLKVDYIDYYLLHSVGGRMEDFNRRFVDNGMMDYLLSERKEGRIRNLGFSFHGSKELFDEMMCLHEVYHWDFVQIQMNYFDWNNDPTTPYLYEQLKQRNISAVIMEPLLGGRLAKVPDSAMREMKRREPDMSIASWAFRSCGTSRDVLTCLSGMTCIDHLEDNVRTFSPLRALTNEEIEFLDGVVHKMLANPEIPCTGCQYCMPCPYGIDIPGIFSYYNHHKDETGRFVKGYNAAIEAPRQADHCIQCGICRRQCPQRINIPEQLAVIDKFVENLKSKS